LAKVCSSSTSTQDCLVFMRLIRSDEISLSVTLLHYLKIEDETS